ncbi:ABC transporter substrate-binding protein [Nonlabens sp. YIK11]|uniref:MlaD family protein n=1 Tax=Nonlabens sp. YIK11 TaxID=1453349 RepID=UPI0006DC1619|nr:MlaD family protein [Nonlabens sp. YIK11]KQC33843.1 ABC transporter substrate-binding protein [Nonlabens sp. YIK11]
MKFTKEIKVGLLTVAAIALFVFGYSFLNGRNLLKADRSFYAVYNNVEGLTKSAPVTINGLIVGNIDDIDFLDSRGRLIVKFHVDEKFNFSKESTATVYSTGLIGGKALAIIPNFESDARLAKPGDTLISKTDSGIEGQIMEEFLPLKDKIENMVVSADSVLTAVNKTLNPDTRKAIVQSLQELNRTLIQVQGLSSNANQFLTNNDKELSSTIKNLNKTTENFAKISDTLAQVQIASVVKDLEVTVGKFNNLLDDVAEGEGTLGKLMTDDRLYTNLERATRQAEMLLQDIKLNPTRYINISVFGKKNKEYVEPDDRKL